MKSRFGENRKVLFHAPSPGRGGKESGPSAPCPLLSALSGEGGFALAIVMVLLVIMTFLGLSALTTTSLDIDISRNIRVANRSFYVTDGCISYARTLIQEAPDLDIMLAGRGHEGDENGYNGFPDYNAQRGVILFDPVDQPIFDYPFSGGNVTIRVRNNQDDPSNSWTQDTDQTVVVDCVGTVGEWTESEIIAAIERVVVGAEYYGDYPQKNLGPQNLNLVDEVIQYPEAEEEGG